MSVSLSFDGFNPGFRPVRARRLRRRIYCLARSESCASVRSLGILGFSGCVRGFSCPKTGTWIVRTRHMHYVPAPLALRGFGSGFRLVGARRLRRRIYCLARSESCASVRALRIRILSGCVRGFFMPKNGCVGSRIPATLSSNVLSITFPP